MSLRHKFDKNMEGDSKLFNTEATFGFCLLCYNLFVIAVQYIDKHVIHENTSFTRILCRQSNHVDSDVVNHINRHH